MQTYFYVIGGALVLIALAISFIGMRSESFPSNNVLRLGIVFVAAVVIATAYGAVKSSQDEQQKREDAQNQVASSEAEQIAVSDTQASGVPDTGGSQAPGDRQQSDTSAAGASGTTQTSAGDPQAGAQIFSEQGCGSCHSLQAAGAVGTIGPNLDEALADKDTAFIETSIVDPSAQVEQGFQDGIMPSDFGDILTPDDLANLVAYLSQSTSSGSASGAAGAKSGSAKK
jgi:mono/diheme cytochrome c family protein